MPRNVMNNLLKAHEVRGALGIQRSDLFHTPESVKYIHEWIERHSKDEIPHLWTVLAMLVNWQEKQLRELAEGACWCVVFDNGRDNAYVDVQSPEDGLRLVRLINVCRTLCEETGWSDERTADDHQLTKDERDALDLFANRVNVTLHLGENQMAEIDPDVIAWVWTEEAAGGA